MIRGNRQCPRSLLDPGELGRNPGMWTLLKLFSGKAHLNNKSQWGRRTPRSYQGWSRRVPKELQGKSRRVLRKP